MRPARGALLAIVALAIVAGLGLGYATSGKAESEQGFLAGLVSRALSTPTTRVHIGRVDGALSSDATIYDIAISDRDGVWLTLDRARIQWRRTALLLRRLEIDSLEIGHLAISRKPLPADEPVKDADKPILPDLPVKVEIKRFTLSDLDLGSPILGTALRASATGSIELGSPSEGLLFTLDGKRLDSPGALAIALTYLPQGNQLSMKVSLDEPAGGLISKIGHLAGEPPVTLRLAGGGTLDAFKADLDFRAGPTIDASGALTLHRNKTGRDLATRVSGHLGGLLPSVAAAIFEGETDLKTDVRIGDDGAVALDDLALVSRLARLDAHGTFGADKTMDFVSSIRAVPNDGEVSTTGAASIRQLVFDGTLRGPVTAPRLGAKLILADAHVPEGTLASLTASFTATPSGAVTDGATRITLEAEAEARGIDPHDVALAHAIGGSASFMLHGSVDTQGEASFQRIEARTPTVTVAYVGDIGRKRLRGRVTGQATDLSRFGDLAGLRLAGEAGLAIDLEGVPKDKSLTAIIAADLQDFSTGLAAVDRLAGRAVLGKGTVATQPGGGFTVSDLTVTGAHVAARIVGTASAKTSDLTAHVSLPDLAQADPKLTGTAAFDAHLTGGLDRPNVALAATIENATALGRPVPHLAMNVAIDDLRGKADTRATLDGTIDRKPARGLVRLARQVGGESGFQGDSWRVGALDLAIGSVAVKGSGSLNGDRLARGTLAITAGNLDDLSALALTKLGGTLSLDATLDAPDGKQALRLDGRGSDLRAAGSAIKRFALMVDARDIFAQPVLNADASVDQADVGGQTIAAVRFTAKGTAASSAMTLSARAAGFDLAAAGALVPGSATKLALTSFSARREARTIALSAPAEFVFADGGVAIRHLALALAGGRLTVDGQIGKTLDLTLDAKAIPLAAADIFAPRLGLGGTLDARATLGGTASAPTGPYRLTVKTLVAPQTRNAGVPPIDIAATGRLEGHRASLEAKIAAGRAGGLTASGSLPLDIAGALDLAIHGKLDASIANVTLGPSGRSVTGSVIVDATITGTKAAPRVGGGASMNGGTFRDSLLGVRLDAIDARLVARGDRIAIEHLSAKTPNDGTLSATGQVQVDPAAGFPGSIAVRGRQATLVSSSLLTATADLAVDVSGPLASHPRIAGRVDVTHVDVAIPDRLPTTLKPIDGIIHVNVSPEARARLAMADKKPARMGTKGRAALFDAALDVVVSAPNRIFLRGRGVDAELGGTLRVGGTTNDPRPSGGFDLRRGKIVALGKTLTFTKGKVTFTGDFVPELDFAAEIQSTDITAQIAVSGPAAAPVFAFTSQPDLPQDEILSRVLFSKSSGSLSGFQALQLAQAAAQFSSGGDDAFEKMRKSLGVDSLDIQGGQSGPSVGISRAISDKVSIGVRTGATAEETGVSADIDVTKHVRVQSDVRSSGATSVGVGGEIEY